MNKYFCEICGSVIYSVGKKRNIKCESCMRKARSRKAREQTNSPYFKRKFDNSGLHTSIYELELYNKEHNTNYTYGKYKALMQKKK